MKITLFASLGVFIASLKVADFLKNILFFP